MNKSSELRHCSYIHTLNIWHNSSQKIRNLGALDQSTGHAYKCADIQTLVLMCGCALSVMLVTLAVVLPTPHDYSGIFQGRYSARFTASRRLEGICTLKRAEGCCSLPKHRDTGSWNVAGVSRAKDSSFKVQNGCRECLHAASLKSTSDEWHISSRRKGSNNRHFTAYSYTILHEWVSSSESTHAQPIKRHAHRHVPILRDDVRYCLSLPGNLCYCTMATDEQKIQLPIFHTNEPANNPL